MKARRLLIPVLVGLLAFEAAPVCACPYRPSLWTLVKDSELIALVRVDSIEQEALPSPGSQPDTVERDVAVLKILVTYKGALRSEVRLNFNCILYAGGHQVRLGDELLVFLETGETQIRRELEMASEVEKSSSVDAAVDQSDTADDSRLVNDPTDVDLDSSAEEPAPPRQDPSEERETERRWLESRIGRWFAAGDGFSTLWVGSTDRDGLDDLVTTAVRGLESGDLSPEAMRDWLVQAASFGATRFDSLVDLQAARAPKQGPEGEASASGLSDSEKRSIAAGFVRDPRPDLSLVLLLSALMGFQDEDLDRTLVAMVDTAVAAPLIPYWVPEAIRFLVASHGGRDWGSAIYERDLESGELKARWPRIAKDLQLSVGSAAALR